MTLSSSVHAGGFSAGVRTKPLTRGRRKQAKAPSTASAPGPQTQSSAGAVLASPALPFLLAGAAVLWVGGATAEAIGDAIANRRLKREEEAVLLKELEERLVGAHRIDFPEAAEPTWTSPPRMPPDQARAVRESYLAQASEDAGAWSPLKRAGARSKAKRRASEEISRVNAELMGRHRDRYDFDVRSWPGLQSADAAVTIEVLVRVFEDNQIPVALVDSDGRHASLVLVFGAEEDLPDRTWSLDEKNGKLAPVKTTAEHRHELYAASMASNVLATFKEAFASTLHLEEVDLLAVRSRSRRFRSEHLEAVCAATATRSELAALDWHGIEPMETLAVDVGAEFDVSSRTGQIKPLSLKGMPDAAEALRALEAQLRPGSA